MRRSKNDLALEYGLKAEKIGEQQQDKRNLYKIYDLIGGFIYFNEQNFKQSHRYVSKMMTIATALNNKDTILYAQRSLGDVYRMAGKSDTAIQLYLKAIATCKEMGKDDQMPDCLQAIGLTYDQQEKYDDAIRYYVQALEMSEAAKLPTSNYSFNIAQAYMNSKDFDQAMYYAQKSMTASKKERNLRFQIALHKMLADIYVIKNDYKNAFLNQSHYLKLKDSIESMESQNKMNAIQNNYKSEKKDKEIGFLQKQSRLQHLLRNVLIVSSVLLVIIAFLIATKYRQKKKSETELSAKNATLEKILTDLKAAQSQLIQAEKMASLGELTAGIAHEIQNPLNFVNNFSEVNLELIAEMKEELEKGNLDEVKAIANDIADNESKINHHGKRADGIVKGMLQHSRNNTGQKEATDINKLADEYLRLAYHGLRAKDKSFNATLVTDFEPALASINVVAQDIGRVLLNLITNAFYAVDEKKKQAVASPNPEALKYEPTVWLSTKRMNNQLDITVTDNGNGIPQHVIDKIFQPFFTTKPTGQGTGLGLSLAYDIVKAHGGHLSVDTIEGEFTTFVISLRYV